MDNWKSKLDFNPIFSFEKGESVIGIFKGTRKVEKIDSFLHGIEVNETRYDIYGCGSLDSQLKDVEPETEIKILYSGKKNATISIEGKTMKKDVHNYTVYTKE